MENQNIFPRRCPTQDDFEKALNYSLADVERMESQLKADGETIQGFYLTAQDPAYVHFMTHEIECWAIDANKLATAYVGALTTLKKSYNLTKSQFRSCVKNFSLKKFCTPNPINCDPATTL